MVGTVVSNCTSHSAGLGSRLHVHRRPHPLTAGLFDTGGKGHIQASSVIAARLKLALFNPIVDRTFAGPETGSHAGDTSALQEQAEVLKGSGERSAPSVRRRCRRAVSFQS